MMSKRSYGRHVFEAVFNFIPNFLQINLIFPIIKTVDDDDDYSTEILIMLPLDGVVCH